MFNFRAFNLVLLFCLSGCIIDPSPKSAIEQASNLEICETARIFAADKSVEGTGFDQTKHYFIELDENCWRDFSSQINKLQKIDCLKINMKCHFHNEKQDNKSYIELLSFSPISERVSGGILVPIRYLFVSIEWS